MKKAEKAQQTEAQSDQMDSRSSQESKTATPPQNIDIGVQTGVHAPQNVDTGVQTGFDAPKNVDTGVQTSVDTPQNVDTGVQTGIDAPQNIDTVVQTSVDASYDSTVDRLNKEVEYFKGKVEKAERRFFKTIYSYIETQNTLKRQLEQKDQNVKKLKHEIEMLKNICGDLYYNFRTDLPSTSSAPDINIDMPLSDIDEPCSTMDSPKTLCARDMEEERLVVLESRKKGKTPHSTQFLYKQSQTKKTPLISILKPYATSTPSVSSAFTGPSTSGTWPSTSGTWPGTSGTWPGTSGTWPGISGTWPGTSVTGPSSSGTSPGSFSLPFVALDKSSSSSSD